jgi:hypothetical protein
MDYLYDGLAVGQPIMLMARSFRSRTPLQGFSCRKFGGMKDILYLCSRKCHIDN